MQSQTEYFNAYRSLKLTRDAKGVLIAEFTATADHSLSQHKITRSLWTPFTEFRKIERIKS